MRLAVDNDLKKILEYIKIESENGSVVYRVGGPCVGFLKPS